MNDQRPQRIFRVRTGCLTCRGRKKKCDETKPDCRGCVRNKLSCRWPSNVSGGHTIKKPATPIRQKPALPPSPIAAPPPTLLWKPFEGMAGNEEMLSPPLEDGVNHHGIFAQPRLSVGGQTPRQPSQSPSSSTTSSMSMPSSDRSDGPVVASDKEEQTIGIELIDGTYSSDASSMQLTISNTTNINNATLNLSGITLRGPTLLPGCSDKSQELLSYYLSTTATSMANGSTSDNPFLVQFIPLAFSSDLVLQLILTQSAAHRAARLLKDTDDLADRYYNNSLRLFRQSVSGYINGTEVEPLTLLVGALIMCFTETAKGDINGTIFDHLMAANSLLVGQLASNETLSKELKDFLVEYYVYTATLSMVSIDARISPQFFLGQELEAMAQDLVVAGYVGNLCGCWLDLILQIPNIFHLGRRIMTGAEMTTADDFVLFSRLQAHILQWTPSLMVSREVQLAGSIFQQAMLLYLYTSLNVLSRDSDGLFAAAMQAAVTKGLSCLTELSPLGQINTSLCWPIAVIGSCLTDPEQQTSLRQRLKVMFNVIGLGNIRQTLVLLDHMWKLPGSDTGPWNICQVMQENQIWISFA